MSRSTPAEMSATALPEHAVSVVVFDARAHLESDSLAGRSEGLGLGQQIRLRLQRLAAGQILLADFSAVRTLEYFALQEALVLLYPGAAGTTEQEKYVVLRADEANTDFFEALELIARERRCVIPSLSTSGRWRLSGKLTQAERATLLSLTEAGRLTSTQLQQRLQLLPCAASNRLRRLYEMRIVRREEQSLAGSGGRRFVYTPLYLNAPSPTAAVPVPAGADAEPVGAQEIAVVAWRAEC